MKAFRRAVIAAMVLAFGLAEAEAQNPTRPANNPLQPNLGVPYTNNSPRVQAARQYLARMNQRRRRNVRRPQVMNYGVTAPRLPF